MYLGPCICVCKPPCVHCQSRRHLSEQQTGLGAELRCHKQQYQVLQDTFRFPETSFKVAFTSKMCRTVATKVKRAVMRQTYRCSCHLCLLVVVILLLFLILGRHGFWWVGTFDLTFSYLSSTMVCFYSVIKRYISSNSFLNTLSFWKECILIFKLHLFTWHMYRGPKTIWESQFSLSTLCVLWIELWSLSGASSYFYIQRPLVNLQSLCLSLFLSLPLPPSFLHSFLPSFEKISHYIN